MQAKAKEDISSRNLVQGPTGEKVFNPVVDFIAYSINNTDVCSNSHFVEYLHSKLSFMVLHACNNNNNNNSQICKVPYAKLQRR